MGWVLDDMRLKPYCCAACGSTPRDDGTGEQLKAAFREAVDINWGDSLYICSSCGRVIGELFGMMSADEAARVVAENDRLKSELEGAQEDLRTLQGRVDRMLDGKKAVSEVRRAKPRKKVSG